MNQQAVVIVEDDKWLAELYARRLTKAGYQVWCSAHALEAIDMIDEHHPNAIVLDMLLAGTTALALLHELQSHPDLANIPIVLASNLADQIALGDVAPYGVKRILDKATMHPDDIVTAVQGVLL